MSCWNVNWGAIEAVGVVSTLVATLVAMEIERRRNRLERMQRLQDRRQLQAAQISAWCQPPADEPPSIDIRNYALATWLVLQNGSTQPVYDVVLYRVQDKNENDPLKRYDMAAVLEVLPPGRWFFPNDRRGLREYETPSIEVAFSDQAAHHWIRTCDGKLRELSDSRVADYNLGQAFLPAIQPYPTSA